MDPRTRKHAEIIVSHCTAVEAGDSVLINAPAVAEDLVVALYKAIGKRGGLPFTQWRNPRAMRSYLRAVDATAIEPKTHARSLMADTDVAILIKASRNAAESSDAPIEERSALNQAKQPVLEERLDTRWVITQHPAPADAQLAEMSTEGWKEYVYDAICQDWAEQHERQQRVADVLESGCQVEITVGDRTDIRFSIDGMESLNDDGRENMPGGEVAISPVVDSVEGYVSFDYPFRRYGEELSGVELTFEEGEVVDYSATTNESVLAKLLDTDDGSARLGEFGIGMNPGIDAVSHNMLFDEKMGGTVHLALGQALEECVPHDRSFNESAVHQDMLIHVTTDASVQVDGETIIEDGTFWFETE